MDTILLSGLISALQPKLLFPSLFPDHLLACLPVLTSPTDLISPLAGSLGLSHSTTDSTNYPHALPAQKREVGSGKKKREGRVQEGVCTCFLIGRASKFLSFPLFAFKFSKSPLHVSYFANENKHSSPPLPPPLTLSSFFSCINSLFVSPQQGALPLF